MRYQLYYDCHGYQHPVFMVIRVDTVWLRVVSRIVLIPVIAGVSYEFLRLRDAMTHGW